MEKIFHQSLVEAKNSKLDLSKLQIECLELLAKGMTYSQIAHYLSLSRRTIEHYIDAVKIKWNCDCRYTLIEKFMNI